MGIALRGVTCSSSAMWTVAEASEMETAQIEGELNKRVMGKMEEYPHL